MKTNLNQIREKMTARRNVVVLSLLASVSMAGYASGNNTSMPKSSPLFGTNSVAQDAKGTVKGTVVDKNGDPMIGVTVKVVGTNEVAVTDLDGNFQLKATPGQELELTYMGYATLKAKAKATMNFTMEEDAQTLGDVVVTALGIKRSEKALSYNVQKLGGENINEVKNANFMNSLSGKVAGVNINASSAGLGGATRVVMRGPKSIGQSNQALYVIDGVPISNRNSGETGSIYSTQPGGEGISDLNPEDIESISVLSGPAAAALYGSAAAQGVIMITTKRGKEGKVSVQISHSSQFSRPFVSPEFQNSYINRPGEVKSWGEKTESPYGAYDPMDFFNTGSNIQNNVAVTAGNDKNQTYISLGTTNAAGIIPNSDYDRYNVTFRNTTSMLKDKLTLDFSFNYIKESDKNLMAQGQYFNPLVGLYLFPRGESFDAVRTFEVWDASRGIYVQNWNFGNDLNMQNPYWVAKRMNRTNSRNRYMVSGSAKYKIFDWLDVTGRMRWDDSNTFAQDKRYASTYYFAHSDYGFYAYDNAFDRNLYGDLMLNVNKTLGDYSIGANVGASLSRTHYRQQGYQGGLKAPSNIFTPNAIDYSQVTNDNRPIYAETRHNINSMFANVELGWRSMLYLTITGRNDWDSALAGTSHESFFYPSVGLSAVISQMAKMPEWINYLKVRGSWASVGTAIPTNLSSGARYEYDPTSGKYTTVTYKFPDEFFPERTNSWEAGVTARFFNNALTFDLTLYQSNTKKQLVTAPYQVDGYTEAYVQTGNIRNRGIELSIGYNKTWGDFTWNPTFTFSANQNKIIKLFGSDVDDSKNLISKGGLEGLSTILREGGTMGDLYSYVDFARDAEGNILIQDGKPVKQTVSGNPRFLGSVLPKANIGLSNEFSWKGINLGFLITARLGGIVLSQTQAMLDSYGVSKASAVARDNGGVPVNLGTMTAENYYSVVGGTNPIWSEYMYSGTNVRLQEAHVSYTLPRSLVGKLGVTLGLTASNLFMIYNKAPFDPESTASTGTYYQGLDYFMQPSLRSLGFSVKVNF